MISTRAKLNNLNTPVLKTLSSYGYMLPSSRRSSPSSRFLSFFSLTQQLPPNWNGLAPATSARLPEMIVDSYDGTPYNTYFYQPRDLQLLSRFAKQNTMSIGELLVRFFYYYGFQLDYIHSGVTIRQRGVLDREEKCCDSMWKMTMQLCIEDPFEDDYDVAHVITPSSSALIQESFAVLLLHLHHL